MQKTLDIIEEYPHQKHWTPYYASQGKSIDEVYPKENASIKKAMDGAADFLARKRAHA